MLNWLLILRLGFVCLMFLSPLGYLGMSSTSALEAQTIASANTGRDSAPNPVTSRVAGDKPLITIAGLCDYSADGSTEDSSCETVITEAQFERVVDAIQPGMPRRARREFAWHYAEGLLMAKKGESLALDKGPEYEEQMKVARIQVLSQDLKRLIQSRASQISDQEIAAYYRDNAAKFEKAKVDRIHVPLRQQLPTVANGTPSETDRNSELDTFEGTMRLEADQLRARAVAGGDFGKLQADAYQTARMGSTGPSTTLEIRRVSLPSGQASVMDLEPGEVSAVFTDANGYFIYKMKAKDTLPFDQAREEIKGILRTQRVQSEMRTIHDSATLTINEGYFSH